MSKRSLHELIVATILILAAASARGTGVGLERRSPLPPPSRPQPAADGRSRPARAETLWIFDADFEDTLGDNAGWTSTDMSGVQGQENYWHIDTIRTPLSRPYVGDYTWWCGTYNVCWRQPRGYGNDWLQKLERAFPEVGENSSPGDQLQLEWDQRYAMERNYDYGYVDISTNGGSTWTTLKTFTNVGWIDGGRPANWDNATYGHIVVDMDPYAGMQNLRLRFRFDSDLAFSSQDQPDNERHSALDGAWQLDNITWSVGSPPVAFWLDDCEAGDVNGWVHEDKPATGQTGVTWWRGLYGTDFVTGRPLGCRAQSGWMYAAVDPLTSKMVDDEYAWLVSPTIDISGATKLVGQWSMWVDLPQLSHDAFNIWVISSMDPECTHEPWGYVDEEVGWWYGGPFWGTWTHNWDAFAGSDWLRIRWEVMNADPPEPSVEHMGGVFLGRQRVGIPFGDPWTTWNTDVWTTFNDWFVDDMSEALLDTALVQIVDGNDIASAYLMASSDSGQTWQAYPLLRNPDSDWWRVPPPANQIAPATVIRYYYEATDGIGNTTVYPTGAPDQTLEMSILPIRGSVAEPCVLLVDKHGAEVPDEHRELQGPFPRYSEDCYKIALEILGYRFDVYDVEVPGGPVRSGGPDTAGMKYYDTQIWFTENLTTGLLSHRDQRNLISWLGQSGAGKERNLLLAGDNIAYDLAGAGHETLSFFHTWLGAYYVADAPGDSFPRIEYQPSGDPIGWLAGGCPAPSTFDVVAAQLTGAHVPIHYVRYDLQAQPAAVAYTHPTLGYETVLLGFGLNDIVGGRDPEHPGWFENGLDGQVSVLGMAMDHFGKWPTGPGTGAPEVERAVNALGLAHPNPFNPATTVEYSVAAGGHVTVRVYSLSGRLVRTLVDGPVEPGRHVIAWDGATDTGGRAASGVYFVRMDTAGFRGEQKLVLMR